LIGLKRSEFLKSVIVLTSGTVVAQLVSYALAPVFTRLYSPGEFGDFGLYIRLVTLISTIATARYELAIPVVKNENHAFQLFRLTIRITLITLGILLISGFVYSLFSSDTKFILIQTFFLLLGTFFLVYNNIGTSWSIRNKTFKSISYSRVSNSISSSIVRVGAGFVNMGYLGLVFSFILSYFISALYFIPAFQRLRKNAKYSLSLKKIKILSKEHKDFPLINLPHALLDSVREIALAFIIVEYFSKEIFGSFDHSFRMLKLPLILIGSSLGQVLLSKVSELKNNNQAIYPTVKKVFFTLTLLSIIPFSVIYFFGESLFAFVFGEEWRQSGIISEMLTFWFLINFISSPLSSIPVVIGKQKQFFVFSVVGSIVQLATFAVIPYYFKIMEIDIVNSFIVLSIINAIFLFIVVAYILHISRKFDENAVEKC
jgi:teichuronic acid exporter